MKRKLINYETLGKIKNESLSLAEMELITAEEVLSKILDTDVHLHCFNEDVALFETVDRTFVHTTYQINNNSLIFENIEELVIDDASTKTKTKEVLTKMVENIMDGKDAKATEAFQEYISLPTVRKNLLENNVEFWVEKPKSKKKRGHQSSATIAERVKRKKESQAKVSPGEKKLAKQKREALKAQFGPGVRVHARFKKQKPKIKKATGKKINEWAILSENVKEYVDHQEFGPVIKQSEFKHDERGNVVAAKIPCAKMRNEGKVLSFNWKTLDTEVKILRSKAKSIAENANFCRAMTDLKKCNALSDNVALEETLENIASKFPELIYLTQNELAKTIGQALEFAGVANYDDQTCEFMAEGILRTALTAYSERVNKVARLAGSDIKTSADNFYESFQKVVDEFYPTLDKNAYMEMQVYTDLYNSLVEIHKISEGNEMVKYEAGIYLNELKSILEQRAEPSLQLAEEVAVWLTDLVETNLETDDWDVKNEPHITTSGDHPQMAMNAAKGYVPSQDFSGNWGDAAPVSDGKSYKGGLADEMRGDGFGNWGGESTYPALKNPYCPDPFGKYTMKGEKGVDRDDDDLGTWQSKDTDPELKNPFLLNSESPKSYHAKSDNLVIDQ